MPRLRRLEGETCSLLYEAHLRFPKSAMLWSMGKDSTVLLHLARKTFRGRLPFPVVHIDTSYKFPQIYAFRERLAREWDLPLHIARNDQALEQGMGPDQGRTACCHALKTRALLDYLQQHELQALILAIRRDEHAVRAKERIFSPRTSSAEWNYREQPPELWGLSCVEPTEGEHVRIHPMLEWTEEDVWAYAHEHRVPMLDLYFATNGGQRYRSVGCQPCCHPTAGTADTIPAILKELRNRREAERAGRAQDKEEEHAMLKLRSLGYM